jgi:hypothetical protein
MNCRAVKSHRRLSGIDAKRCAKPRRHVAYAASVGVARRFFQSQYHAIQMQIS